jgi:hypothetical protein
VERFLAVTNINIAQALVQLNAQTLKGQRKKHAKLVARILAAGVR